MASRKSVAGGQLRKKTKKQTEVKEEVIALVDLPPLPLLREALICAVDEPKRWAKSGLASSAMPKYAKMAALASSKGRCLFCAHKLEAMTAERAVLFHPEYPLCSCLMPFRKTAFDYVENWDSVEGKKQILAQIEAGKVALDTPVYQYFCQCGEGPVVVDYKAVSYGLRTHGKHTRRRLCGKCYQKVAAKRAQLNNAMHVEAANAKQVLNAEKVKQGPAARINKIKQAKNSGPSIPPLPPLNAVISEAQATSEKEVKKAAEVHP